MKILFIASSESIHSHKWISYFIKKGHDILWYSMTDVNSPTNFAGKFFANRTGAGFFYFVFCYFRARRIVKNYKPDIIHAHSAGHYGLLASLLPHRELVITVWGSDIVINTKKFFHRQLLRRFLPRAILVTSDSPHMLETIKKHNIKIKNGLLVNFGVDTEQFKPSKIGRKRSTNRSISIVSTRSFEPIYDIETLIYATQDLLKDGYKLTLNLVGTGSQHEKLSELAKRLGIEAQVIFRGRVEYAKLPELLNSMDLYVSTSKSDAGIAASTAEAMACCVPCIISDVYDNQKWIQPEKTGFLFQVSDKNSLASQIRKAINLDEEKMLKLTEAARKKIVQENSFSLEMNKMEATLLRLVESQNKAARP